MRSGRMAAPPQVVQQEIRRLAGGMGGASKPTAYPVTVAGISGPTLPSDPNVEDLQAHLADLTNPHEVTYTQAGAAAAVHTHVKADITDWAHTHIKADITDFAHTHVEADITDLVHNAVKLQGRNINSAAPASGNVLAWNAGTSVWEPTAPAAGSSHEMLSATHTDSTVGTVVRGDVITGQGATPKWTRLAIGTANYLLGVNAAGQETEYKQIAGTSNQVTVTHAASLITLSAPQNLHSAATPTFGGLTVDGNLTLSDGSSRNLFIGGASSGNEGGQITMYGAGAYTNWNWDLYQDTMRWFTGGGVVCMQLNNSGHLGVYGGIRIGSPTPPGATNYYSSDGSAGLTETFDPAVKTSLVFKNGLLITAT